MSQDAPAPDETTDDAATSQVGWGAIALLLLSRAWRVIRRIVRVVRPLGWIVIVLAVVTGLLGMLFGWAEVRTIAVILATVALVCLVFLIGRTSYGVTLDLTRSRVVVGEKAIGAITLSNTGTRHILPSRVVLPVGAGRGVFAVKRLAPEDSVEEVFAIPTQRRAVLPVGPVSIVRGDPLGLYERIDERDEPATLYVHPRTVAFDAQSIGFVRDLEGMETRDLARDDIAFHALSEYQPGDDLRHVHWRSTARTGTLMMRTYEQTRRSYFVIGLATATSDYGDADEFELAVSVAGSLGLRALKDSFNVDVRSGAGPLRSETGKHLLDSLSGVNLARGRSGRVGEVAVSLASSIPTASIVVLVTGSGATPDNLRQAAARIPAGTRSLVVIAQQDGDSERRQIGETDAITLSRLDDLPLALKRVLG